MPLIKEWISWRDYCRSLRKLYKVINPFKEEYKYIYGIPRGGLFPATYLSYQLDIPLILALDHVVDNKILVVDDLVDTGKTVNELIDANPDMNLFDVAVIYYKPHSVYAPKYYLETTTNWIVFPYESNEEKPNRAMYSHL